MSGLGTGLGLTRRSGSTAIDPDAQAFFVLHAADGGTLSAQSRTAINAWFVASAGYRHKIRRANFFINDAASLSGVLVPAVRAGASGSAKDANSNFVPGDHGAPGLTGNGTNKHLDTGYDPYVEGDTVDTFGMHAFFTGEFAFDDTDAPMGTYAVSGDRADIGLYNVAPYLPLIYINGNTGGPSGGGIPALTGLLGASGGLPIAGASRAYRNGAALATDGTNSAWSGALGNMTIFALNLLGTPSRHCAAKMGAYVFTRSMTAGEIATMYTDLHALMQGLGRVA